MTLKHKYKKKKNINKDKIKKKITIKQRQIITLQTINRMYK